MWPQAIGHHLAHRNLDVEVEEAVPEPRLEALVLRARQQRARARVVPIEVLDDDRGFRDGPIAVLVAQDGYLAERPQIQECAAGVPVRQIQDELLNGRDLSNKGSRKRQL